MANKDQSKGLEPAGKVISARIYVAGGTVYPGDVVTMGAAGTVTAAAAGTTANTGVAISYAVSGNDVLVADSPDQEFLVQADDAGVAAQTNLGLNYNITVGTASTLYKRSAMELDGSTGASDSNLPLRALRLANTVDNAFGDQADVIVKLNNHQRAPSSVGL
jgi:hypothetical protein